MKLMRGIYKFLSNTNQFLRLLIILLLLAVVGGLFWMNSSNGQTKITSSLIRNRLESAKELVTSKYYYTNVVSFENTKEFYGVSIPFTTKSFIVSYDGIINSGLDLEKMTVDVQQNKIVIDLPEASILSHEIDQDSLKIYNEENSIFNSLTIEDYSGFYKDEEKKIEQEAVDKGMLTKAEEDAQQAIKSILNVSPEIESNYSIEFK